MGLFMARLLGWMTGDVVLTSEEVDGLTRGLLKSAQPPRGQRSFRRWLESEGASIGTGYRNEVRRHFEHAR
jgi:hypothetical protein